MRRYDTTDERKVNAYSRPVNQRLRILARDFARSLGSGEEPPVKFQLDVQAVLQHAEAALFHARAGRYNQARAALANCRLYAGKAGIHAVGDELSHWAQQEAP